MLFCYIALERFTLSSIYLLLLAYCCYLWLFMNLVCVPVPVRAFTQHKYSSKHLMMHIWWKWPKFKWFFTMIVVDQIKLKLCKYAEFCFKVHSIQMAFFFKYYYYFVRMRLCVRVRLRASRNVPPVWRCSWCTVLALAHQ